jgi:hypothetical protein
VAKDGTSGDAPREAQIAAAVSAGVFFGLILAVMLYAILAG